MRTFATKISLILVLLFAALKASSQVTVNLVLAPPYSPYFSDYLSYENKAVITIIRAGSTPTQIYFKGSIIGDNGVSLLTKPGYKPGTPIDLFNTTTVLNGSNIGEYFTWENTQITGTTPANIIKNNGLPEGNYKVCITPFDYSNDVAAGAEACFSFNIKQVEPPVLITPACNSNVIPNRGQVSTFSWSPSPGAPPNARYVMTMVELVNPDQNPNDAMNMATTPPFFEEDEGAATVNVYTMADPYMTPGKTYAWRVQVYDPKNLTAFRNNGFSEACKFTYKPIEVAPAGSGGNKLIVSMPKCGKLKDTIKVSDISDAQMSWMWQAQIDDDRYFVHPENMLIDGRRPRKYKVTFTPAKSIKGDPMATVSFDVFAPKQVLVLSLASIEKFKLSGKNWILNVKAYDSAGNVIGDTSSCQFLMFKVNESDKKQVFISGTLVYKFTNGTELKPANNTTISLQLNPKKQGMPTYGGSDPLDMSRPYLTITTNENGEFSGNLDLNPGDTSDQKLGVFVRSPYYKGFSEPLKVNMSYQKKDDASGKMVNYGQKDTMNLGQLVTAVYSFDMKVVLGKGFPSFFVDSLTKNLMNKDVSIDTLSINPKSQVKAGITVKLYRKTKDNFIPFYEAGKLVKGPAGSSGVIAVAEAKTTIVKNAKGENETIVEFKNLVINFAAGDKYFIKADIPAKSTGYKSPFDINSHAGTKGVMGSGKYYGPADDMDGEAVVNSKNDVDPKYDEDQDLVAPEMEYTFPKSSALLITHYNVTVKYKLVSTIPPLSQITGKLVYSWPSEPNVVRPLANARFSVRLTYMLDNKPVAPPNDPAPCTITMTKIEWDDPSENKGDKTYLNQNDEGLVVGTGETDEQGNFTIKIINHNRKGVLTNHATITQTTVKDPGCEKKGESKQNPLDKLHWGENETWGEDWMDKGFDKGENMFNILDFSNGAKATNGFGGNSGFSMNGVNGGFSQGLGMGANGAAGLGAKGAGASTNITIQGIGPAEPGVDDMEGAQEYKVERGLYIALDAAWGQFYSNILGPGSDKENFFFVNAFETKDIGTFTCVVNEVMTSTEKRIYFPVKSPSNGNQIVKNFGLTGAKCVVFRMQAKPKYLPEGEGSSNHPQKKLLKPSFSDDYYIDNLSGTGNSGDYKTQAFEWVVDASLDLGYDDAKGQSFISFEGHKLLARNGKYLIQVTPDPQNGGPSFRPIVTEYDGVQEAEVYLKPSRIAGRLVDKSSKHGIAGKVNLLMGSTVIHAKTIDTSGYWEFINGKITNNGDWAHWNDGTGYFFTCESVGYKMGFSAGGPIDKEGKTQYFYKELEPAAKATGVIVNENNIPIEAYIMRDDSMVFENKVDFSIVKAGGISLPLYTGGNFEIPITNGTTHKFKIIPKDVGYFDTTLSFYISSSTSTKDLKTIMVYRRKHRMVFNLKFADANGNPMAPPIQGFAKNTVRATINNDNTKSTTNSKYGTQIEMPPFENVSSTKYSVLFEGVNNGYIPVTLNITNQETRDPVVYDVVIKSGVELHGKVTMNGKAVRNAKVYIDMQTSSGTIGNGTAAYNNLEARTGADGSYTIYGIPKTEAKIRVFATLDTTFTVSGDMKMVKLSGLSTNVNFILTEIEGVKINNLYGFPLSVEKAELLENGNYKISGLVDITKGQTKFQWLDPEFKVRVVDVEFKQNKGVGSPVKNTVDLDACSKVKMKYLNRYNVDLRCVSNQFINIPLVLEKSGEDGGVLKCYAYIADNSFDFPSTYLSFDKTGLFYLGVRAGDKLETVISAISSKPVAVATNYYLGTKVGDSLSFSFIGFTAKAIPASSYIANDGKIHLSVNVRGASPSAKLSEVKFHIPDLVIDNDHVYQAEGSEPLILNMQNWKLEVRDWKVNPTKGGLISENCMIKTGVVDIPAKKFNLRHDFFFIDDFDLTKLSLGGGVLNLSEISPESDLVFDEHCGSDLGAHWRFVIGKNGSNPAAKITGLNPYISQAIPLDYIQLISFGNENILSMGNVSGIKNMFKNEKITFIPKQIVSGANTFNLSGEAQVAVPRFPAMSMSVNFTGTPGNINANLEPLKFSFEAPGYANFTCSQLKSPTIDKTNGKFTIDGQIEEPGKMNPIDCKLTFGGGENGRITLPAGAKVYLTSGSGAGPYIELSNKLDSNGLWVSGNDWNHLRFHGKMYDPNTTSVTAAAPTMYFEVFGEIKASSKSISMNEIKTPFGDMEMTFDFQKKQLYGLLVIKEGTKIGTWDVTGQVETWIDPGGFLVLGIGTINTGTLFVDGYGLFKIGFVLGGHSLTTENIAKACTYAVNPEASCWLVENKNNFKGFWFCGNNQMVNEDYNFNAIIAQAYVHADATIEASLGVNFGGTPNFEMNIAAFGHVKAGMSAITGTYIEGHLDADAIARIAYKGGLTFDARGDLSLEYKICQTLPFVDDICYSDTKGCALKFGYNGSTYFSFSLDGPGDFKGCLKEEAKTK